MSDNAVPPLEASAYHRAISEVSHFLDVPLELVIQLSQKSMKVREILLLAKDSIVDLPKSAGENVDLFVNGKLIAYGEVLEIEGKAGVRLTDMLPEV
jgi:flagellar motor switch protein FliN